MAFHDAMPAFGFQQQEGKLVTKEATPEPVAFRWDQDRIEENERFREALNKTELRKDIFNEKFIDALEKRNDALADRQRKAMLFMGSATLLLAVALLAVNVPVSLFGLSASNAANLREVLLIIIASVPLYTLFGSIEQLRIADAMKAWISRTSRGDKHTERVLLLRYGLGTPTLLGNFQRLGPEVITWSTWRKVKLTFAFVGGILWLLLTIGMVIVLEIWGLLSILFHPTVSVGFSLLVIVYVVCAYCVSYGMRAAAGVISGPPEAK